jgi:hypothetical protein
MKKYLLAGVGLIAISMGVPALAADMPVKAAYKAPPIVYAYSWTGCYIGGHVGGLWVRKDATLAAPGIRWSAGRSHSLGLPRAYRRVVTTPAAWSAESRRVATINSPAVGSLACRVTMAGPTQGEAMAILCSQS